MASKNTDNYLDFVPAYKEDIKYTIEDGKVTIFVENKGLFNYLAQKF